MTTTAEQPTAAKAAPPAAAVPTPRWRAAFLGPAVVAVPWVLLTAGSGLPAPVPTAGGAVLLLLLAATTGTDLCHRRIPNWATYSAVAWALALHLAAAAVPADWAVRVPGPFASAPVPVAGLLVGTTAAEAAAGFAIGFGVMLLLYGIFQGGAGDVKLVAAVGAFVGGERVLSVVAYGYILAGVVAACYLVWTVGPLALFREVGRALGLLRRPPGVDPIMLVKVPMAPFLNAGVLLAVFWRTV